QGAKDAKIRAGYHSWRQSDMTEAEWLACTDPQPMLNFVTDEVVGRKLCLFACACCHRIQHLLPHEESRRALQLPELYVEGEVAQQSLLEESGAAEAVDGQ